MTNFVEIEQKLIVYDGFSLTLENREDLKWGRKGECRQGGDVGESIFQIRAGLRSPGAIVGLCFQKNLGELGIELPPVFSSQLKHGLAAIEGAVALVLFPGDGAGVLREGASEKIFGGATGERGFVVSRHGK